MKNTIRTLFFILVFAQISFSQNQKLEDLKTDLAAHSERDEARVKILQDIVFFVSDTNVMKTYAEEAIEIAKEVNVPNLEAEILRIQAIKFAQFGNPQRGLAMIQETKKIRNTDSNSKIETAVNEARLLFQFFGKIKEAKAVLDEARSINDALPKDKQNTLFYNASGLVAHAFGDFEGAEKNYLEVVRLGRLTGQDVYPALSNLGNLATDQGLFDKALNYFLQAIEKGEDKNPIEISGIYLNVANLYNELDNNEKALEYAEKGLEIATSGKYEKGVIKAMSLLGYIHKSIGNLEQSKNYTLQGYEIAERVGDVPEMSQLSADLCLFFENTGQLDSMIFYGEKARKLLEGLDAPERKIQIFRVLGMAYTKSNQLPKAAGYLKKADMLLDTFDYASVKLELEREWYQFYKKSGKPAEALSKFENLYNLRDSVTNIKRTEQMAEMQTKYETEKKELENKNLLAKNDLIAGQNRQFKIGAGILGAMLCLLSYFFFQLRKTGKQLADQNQQLTNLNATKDKFFGIIAHDIRSPIGALTGIGEQMDYYLKKDDKEKLTRLTERIESTAQKLTNLLDNLLNWALLQKGMIPYHPKPVNLRAVADENLELYKEVADLKNIILKNEVSEDIMAYADESAVSTILRNLINNAVKFTSKNGEVSVSIEQKNDKVFIKINDTGTGIAADKMSKLFSLNTDRKRGTSGEKGSGLGLMLCKDLVELNKGNITVSSEPGKGSEFVFSLPTAV